MKNLQNPEFYRKARIEALRDLLQNKGLDAIVLYSRENTLYYTGFTGTTSFALISTKTLNLFLDTRYYEQGKTQCPEYEVELAQTVPYQSLTDFISKQGYKKIGLEAEYLPWQQQLALQKSCPEVQFVALTNELSLLRMVKDEMEMQFIRKAIWISDEAWRQLLPTIKVGQTENQIAAQLEHNMRMLGASSPSFTTIMASGVRGALPHGVASDKKVELGEAITMDFGALYQGYCSDITRTIFLGTPNPEILKIYNIVLEAQLNAEKHLKSGMKGCEVDSHARRIIDEAGYGQYFGHGTGHSLGIEIHEPPYSGKTGQMTLPAGCTMTVEPGIYVPGLGGVRIEDTCLVRENDCEVLTAADKSVIVLNG